MMERKVIESAPYLFWNGHLLPLGVTIINQNAGLLCQPEDSLLLGPTWSASPLSVSAVITLCVSSSP